MALDGGFRASRVCPGPGLARACLSSRRPKPSAHARSSGSATTWSTWSHVPSGSWARWRRASPWGGRSTTSRGLNGVAESALWVGLLGLATFIPLFFLALPAGVVADRYSAGCCSWHASPRRLCARRPGGRGAGRSHGPRAHRDRLRLRRLPAPSARPRGWRWRPCWCQAAAAAGHRVEFPGLSDRHHLGPALAGFLVAQWSSAHSYGVSFLYLVAHRGGCPSCAVPPRLMPRRAPASSG